MSKIKKPSDREQFVLRIPINLKEQLEQKAYDKGISLNAYILNKLQN